MSNKFDEFLLSLRELAKAYKKLEKAVPDPLIAEQVADSALKRTLDLLNDPSLADQIAKSLPAARKKLVDSPDTFDSELIILELEEVIRAEADITLVLAPKA